MIFIVFALPAPAAGPIGVQTPAGKGPFLAIVAVHGGGWTAGSASDAMPFCRSMVRAGYACAAVDYGLAPATRFPGQIDDLRAAIEWLLANAGRLNLKTQGVLLAGESAGGHLVSFLGATQPAHVLGVIAFSPPTDLVALCEPGRALGLIAPEVRALTGVTGWSGQDVEKLRAASPLFAVRPGAPPFLIFHGSADLLVPPSQSRMFCKALSDCKLAMIPGARHGLWSEEQLEKWEPEWRPTLIRWIEATQNKRSRLD